MKLRITVLVFVACFLMLSQAFAISEATSKGLEAFRRYEPDFSTAITKLQELWRKVQNQGLDPASDAFAKIRTEAADIMEFVQKRYDLLDDLYKSYSGDYPEDRPALLEGFQRTDDLYRKCRDFYMEKFTESGPATSNVEKQPAKVEEKAQPAPKEDKKPVPATQPDKKSELSLTLPPPIVNPPSVTEKPSVAEKPRIKSATEDQSHKAALTGSLKLDGKNRNEKFTAQNTALPNNLYQARLSLKYDFDPKNKFVLDDKYLQRKRNELVKENVLTLAFLHKHSIKTNVTAKDTLHHVWYPQNTQKEYRDNLAELFWNKKEGKWEYLYDLGYQTRDYPNYSKSDFSQINSNSQTTYFIRNGTLFGESTHNWREYKNSPSLDYINSNYFLEYNRSFSGNKSEIGFSDTYDNRHYGNEAVNLFRTNYWDNYFRFHYDLPVSKTFTWLFEDEWQKRLYPSDDPRGYAQVKLKTAAKITIDNDTRARITHIYTNNVENTKAKAHKNHDFNGMWEKNFSKTFKLKVEDNYHKRSTLIGRIMDFRENMFSAKATWKLPQKIELTWRNEYLQRVYRTLYYPDYKYFTTGVAASYAKPKKYDWQLEQAYRKFSFQNGNNISTPWTSKAQPFSMAKLGFVLRDNLRLKFTASYEKTYYKTFDTLSQELLWDFTRPMTITEFFGGLEYEF